MRSLDINKKEMIILSAIELINNVGLAKTSMSKIARKAGVSVGTIYLHFKNKDDMIINIYLHVKQEMVNKIFQGIDITSVTEVVFKNVFKNYIDFLVNKRDYFLFFEQVINSPQIRKLDWNEHQLAGKGLLDFIELGKERGVFKNMDKDLLLTYATSPLIQIAKKYFTGEFEYTEQNVDKIIKMSWDALKV